MASCPKHLLNSGQDYEKKPFKLIKEFMETHW
jgi:hypothetical protein